MIKYDELTDEVKEFIELEAEARSKFKLEQFMESIKNIAPFYKQSFDPYISSIGNDLTKVHNILHERYVKELNMGIPYDSLILEKRHKFIDKVEMRFWDLYSDKLRGKIDSRILFNIGDFIRENIEIAFDFDKRK